MNVWKCLILLATPIFGTVEITVEDNILFLPAQTRLAWKETVPAFQAGQTSEILTSDLAVTTTQAEELGEVKSLNYCNLVNYGQVASAIPLFFQGGTGTTTEPASRYPYGTGLAYVPGASFDAYPLFFARKLGDFSLARSAVAFREMGLGTVEPVIRYELVSHRAFLAKRMLHVKLKNTLVYLACYQLATAENPTKPQTIEEIRTFATHLYDWSQANPFRIRDLAPYFQSVNLPSQP